MVRGSFGLFYDRVPLRALANALLSAATPPISPAYQPDQRQPLAHAGRRAGVSRTSCSAALPSGVLVNFTTMDPHMQNAYSEQGSLEIEQQLGDAAAR